MLDTCFWAYICVCMYMYRIEQYGACYWFISLATSVLTATERSTMIMSQYTTPVIFLSSLTYMCVCSFARTYLVLLYSTMFDLSG